MSFLSSASEPHFFSPIWRRQSFVSQHGTFSLNSTTNNRKELRLTQSIRFSVLIGHRFVGYIEEEACHTYTKIVGAIEEAPEGSELAAWRTEHAPAIAKAYWKLGETGTVLDLVYAVRADEAEHRDVNHACSNLAELNGGPKATNPFNDPNMKVNELLRKYVNDVMIRNNNGNDKLVST